MCVQKRCALIFSAYSRWLLALARFCINMLPENIVILSFPLLMVLMVSEENVCHS
jgi:hypothetical protein